MKSGIHFEVLADCSACGVQGAVVELYDSGTALSHFGIPLEARCRFCNATWEGTTEPTLPPVKVKPGRCPACQSPLDLDACEHHRCNHCGLRSLLCQTLAPAPLATREQIVARLLAFAREEGLDGTDELLERSFCAVSLEQLHQLLTAKARVPTNFDAFDFLFGHVCRATASAQWTPAPEIAKAVAPEVDARETNPRALLYPIVSVMVADGAIDPAERRFVSAFLEGEGQAPLQPHEIRVHAPALVGPHIPPHRQREVVQLMIQLAAVDGTADTSELRVAQAYARDWGIADADFCDWVDHYRTQHASAARRFLLKLRSFFIATEPPGSASKQPFGSTVESRQ